MAVASRYFVIPILALLVACGGSSGSSDGSDDVGDAGVQGVVIRWRPTSDAVGYVVHWGSTSGVYFEALDVGAPHPDADGVASTVVDYAGARGTIYVSLTSYDGDGRVSAFSNEIAASVP